MEGERRGETLSHLCCENSILTSVITEIGVEKGVVGRSEAGKTAWQNNATCKL